MVRWHPRLLSNNSKAVTDGALFAFGQVDAKEGIVAVHVLHSLDHILMLCCTPCAQQNDRENNVSRHFHRCGILQQTGEVIPAHSVGLR